MFDFLLCGLVLKSFCTAVLEYGNRCSTYQSGDLTKIDKAIDGIFGFGQHDLSVISQLSSHGVTPRVFSHCLKGDGSGGGILVLGEILDSSIVYSPLVPSQYVFIVSTLKSSSMLFSGILWLHEVVEVQVYCAQGFSLIRTLGFPKLIFFCLLHIQITIPWSLTALIQFARVNCQFGQPHSHVCVMNV